MPNQDAGSRINNFREFLKANINPEFLDDKDKLTVIYKEAENFFRELIRANEQIKSRSIGFLSILIPTITALVAFGLQNISKDKALFFASVFTAIYGYTFTFFLLQNIRTSDFKAIGNQPKGLIT